MNVGHREVCLDHDTGQRHPESPDRIRAIRRTLADAEAVEYATPETATLSEITAVHDPGYIASFEDFCASGGGSWDADTIAVEATYEAALASAGIALWAARAALGHPDRPATPFAIGRPPGHHAVTDDAMGFCFLNNVAIAAETLLRRGRADRIAIVDWDVHHGNGTQDIFYDRGDVLYVSIHEEGLFPGTGALSETGTGPGVGRTLNVPFRPGSGDPEYEHVLDTAIEPTIAAFDPDLVLVSAGFDAHRRDPISRMTVSTEGYGRMAARLLDLAGRIDAGLGFVLEGGYGLETLSDSVDAINAACNGDVPDPIDAEADPHSRQVVDRLRDVGFVQGPS
ncbi:histone deacetylase family protein [Halococcoides cellulosivorans]|uniref:Histone deacetylase n=1 Tax=Halococcoides cellulosivorans TaxID=1679096 RepID=A0A2R4X2F9_9EURY|nr:histone deacetylase [Halococcoides cellulosivorans]AWB27965.1 histone deacetylase [Halococcoides cellulosivorans]